MRRKMITDEEIIKAGAKSVVEIVELTGNRSLVLSVGLVITRIVSTLFKDADVVDGTKDWAAGKMSEEERNKVFDELFDYLVFDHLVKPNDKVHVKGEDDV